MSVLNPWLYNRLKELFGEVHIANNGIPLQYKKQYDPLSNKERLIILQRGEAYQVNCPFCLKRVGRPDKRFRLWINHRWGFGGFGDNSKFWFLCICYNENCLELPENQEALRKSVFDPSAGNLLPTTIISETPSIPEIVLPENLISINTLPDSHPATIYLKARQFDPTILWRKYGVYFCPYSSHFPIASGRIVIPIYLQDKLISWQARAIDHDNIRYYSCKGGMLSHTLYGWNQLEDSSFAILVEGITDVWRLGSPALALFGHHLSLFQLRLLQQRFHQVAFLLDGDVKKDKLDRLYSIASPNFEKTMVTKLPEALDPADLRPTMAAAIKQGISRQLCELS